MTTLRIIRDPFRRARGILSLAAVMTIALTLASCGDDDTCSTGDYATVISTIDSARWLHVTKDTLIHGVLDKGQKSRFTAWLHGWSTWESRPTVKSYIQDMAGEVLIRGRLGLPDTFMYFEVDSFLVDPGNPNSASVRLEFRSKVSDWRYDSSTYWNVRGHATCTLPFDANLAGVSAFSCTITAAGDHETFLDMNVDVGKSSYEYDCPNNYPMMSSSPGNI